MTAVNGLQAGSLGAADGALDAQGLDLGASTDVALQVLVEGVPILSGPNAPPSNEQSAAARLPDTSVCLRVA